MNKIHVTTQQKLDQTALLLGVAANPTRLKIMLLLSEHVELSVIALQKQLGKENKSLSHYLINMKDAGLLKSRSQAKYIFYSLRDPSIMNCLQTLIQSRTVHIG